MSPLPNKPHQIPTAICCVSVRCSSKAVCTANEAANFLKACNVIIRNCTPLYLDFQPIPSVIAKDHLLRTQILNTSYPSLLTHKSAHFTILSMTCILCRFLYIVYWRCAEILMTFASFLRRSRGSTDSCGRNIKSICDSHVRNLNQFLREQNVVGILGVLNGTPLTPDVLRLVCEKLQSETFSQLPTPTIDDDEPLFDELFAILFLCSLSRSNVPVCWPWIYESLVLGDPNPYITLPSVGNILLGLFKDFMHMFECIFQDRIFETLKLLQPRLHMLPSNRRGQTLGFDTGLLYAVSIAPYGWTLLLLIFHLKISSLEWLTVAWA